MDPDYLGQTNYTEICILVTKYKIHVETEQSTKYKLRANYLITVYVFQILYSNYSTTLQTNTQNNLGFSHALPAAHAV